MIPTGQRAAAWCARYLHDARPKLAIEPDDGTLFLTVDGVAFSLGTLTYLMRDYVRRSGVGKPGACHIFRHTMATVMLEGGADIRYIQQMLGHANITSTQVYTQVSLQNARRGPRGHAPRLLQPATPPPPGRRDPAPGQLGAGCGGQRC